jgi:hypothetical protein
MLGNKIEWEKVEITRRHFLAFAVLQFLAYNIISLSG